MYPVEWFLDDEADVDNVSDCSSLKEPESEVESDPVRKCSGESPGVTIECLLDVADDGGVMYPYPLEKLNMDEAYSGRGSRAFEDKYRDSIIWDILMEIEKVGRSFPKF